jgi:RNA polymerase sigma factor (sigma-70 family)
MALAPFEQVVAEHGPSVLRVCRAVLEPADAEDAWAETFLAALRAYPRLDPDANVLAWLVRIAQRKAVDLFRSRARGAVPVASVPDRPAPAEPAEARDLRAALANLPRRQREAVAYHYLAGLAYKEVAALSGGSADAARRAAADGIASLRKLFLDSTNRKGGKR